MLDTMTEMSPPEYSFVLTNVLFESDEDREHYADIEGMAKARKALFIPVRLLCSVEENKKRIVMPDRAARFKEINPEAAAMNAKDKEVLKAAHPNVLTLDVTNLTARESAQAILAHASARSA